MGDVKYNLITLFAFAFWIAETWYFGWNMKPQTGQEALCDAIVVVLFVWGIVGGWLKDVTFVKKTSITLQPGQKIDEVLWHAF